MDGAAEAFQSTSEAALREGAAVMEVAGVAVDVVIVVVIVVVVVQVVATVAVVALSQVVDDESAMATETANDFMSTLQAQVRAYREELEAKEKEIQEFHEQLEECKNEGENFKVKTAHNMWRGLLNERRNKFSKSSNQKTKVSAIVQHAPLPALSKEALSPPGVA